MDLLMKTQRGFAMIETLVAVLILLLGIVGAIGMQTKSTIAISEASGRAEVTIAAEELLGIMWSDQANIATYASGVGTPPASYTAWYDKLNASLPGITVNVAISAFGPAANPGSQIDINFTWQRPGQTDTRQYAVTSFVSPP
jgi:type IV pilus assembly protein PilV